MKRILLDKLDIMLPLDMQRLCEGAEVYDGHSCCGGLQVTIVGEGFSMMKFNSQKGEETWQKRLR